MFIYNILLLIKFITVSNGFHCSYDVSIVTSTITASNEDEMVALRISFDCPDNEIDKNMFLHHQVSLGFEPVVLLEEIVHGDVISRFHNDVILVKDVLFKSVLSNESSLQGPCWIGLLERSSDEIDKLVIHLKSNGLGEQLDDLLIVLNYESGNRYPNIIYHTTNANNGISTQLSSDIFSTLDMPSYDQSDMNIWNDFYYRTNCSYLYTCQYTDVNAIDGISFWQPQIFLIIKYSLKNRKYFSRIPFKFRTVINNSSYDKLYINNETSLLSMLKPMEASIGTDPEYHDNNIIDDDWRIEIGIFPSKVYLDYNECVHVNVTLELSKRKSSEYLVDWEYEDYKLFVYPLNSTMVAIEISQSQDEFYTSKIYQISICNILNIEDWKLLDKKNVTSHLDFYVVRNDNIVDSQDINIDLNKSLVIVHTCPPHKRVYFDVAKSKEGKSDYCSEDNCFHYDNEFTPIFVIVDDITMSESDFIGAYNITIIGGGEKMDKMIQYSNYEQYLYNVKAGSTLIWAGGAAQGYRWLCASGSPCGGITPEFPNTPYYYLMLQFSNEGLENTYCAYTFNFTIMLHGMPPDGLYPSLFIVLLCIFLMMGMLISLYVLEIKYPDVYTDARQWLQNKKTSILSRWRFRNKVGLQSSSKEDGLQSVSSKESILKEHTAKVLQWIDTAPEHPQNIP